MTHEEMINIPKAGGTVTFHRHNASGSGNACLINSILPDTINESGHLVCSKSEDLKEHIVTYCNRKYDNLSDDIQTFVAESIAQWSDITTPELKGKAFANTMSLTEDEIKSITGYLGTKNTSTASNKLVICVSGIKNFVIHNWNQEKCMKAFKYLVCEQDVTLDTALAAKALSTYPGLQGKRIIVYTTAGEGVSGQIGTVICNSEYIVNDYYNDQLALMLGGGNQFDIDTNAVDTELFDPNNDIIIHHSGHHFQRFMTDEQHKSLTNQANTFFSQPSQSSESSHYTTPNRNTPQNPPTGGGGNLRDGFTLHTAEEPSREPRNTKRVTFAPFPKVASKPTTFIKKSQPQRIYYKPPPAETKIPYLPRKKQFYKPFKKIDFPHHIDEFQTGYEKDDINILPTEKQKKYFEQPKTQHPQQQEYELHEDTYGYQVHPKKKPDTNFWDTKIGILVQIISAILVIPYLVLLFSGAFDKNKKKNIKQTKEELAIKVEHNPRDASVTKTPIHKTNVRTNKAVRNLNDIHNIEKKM